MQKRHQSSQDLAEVENRPERRNPSDLSGLVELDAQKIQDQMRHCRTSKSELAIKAKVSRRTIDSVLEHGRCQARVAYSVAKALKLPGHEDLMPDADHETASATMPSKKRTIGEWVVLGKPTAWKSLSNGLQYKVWKMERRLVPGSFGRGKCYDLERMSDEERAETERRLMRHPAICDGIGRHPAIPTNKHAGFEGKNHFWVIDVWEEGPSLSEVLKQGPLEPDRLPQVMRQIAEGLQVLHENKIARRELTPDFVVLRGSDHSVLLTDLELARILDGSPPTPLNWKENPYVAPEVFSGKVDKRADLFSWGQILYHASAGKAPPKLPGTSLFDSLDLPRSVKEMAKSCVSISPSMRPRSFRKVVKAIRNWR